MIKVSENALQKIKNLRVEEKKEDTYFLRIKVKRGGCSGFSYKLDFDNAIQEKDKSLELDGLKIVIDSQSLLYILGMTLDYEGGLNGSGFIFQNPNASKTCGCGTSFAV